jgi:hypothetical protein
LGFTVGVDGVAIFKTPALSMWPIMAINNNLCPQERFKEQNIILLGMWVHESLAPPQSLLKIFIEDCRKNFQQGII